MITRAVLKLSPQPRSTCTALCALADYNAVLALLKHVRTHLGPNLSAFEMMWPDFYERMTTGLAHLTTPLPYGHGAYVLIESQGTDPIKDEGHFEQTLSAALESEIVHDVVIAQSESDVKRLWAVRDSSGEFRAVFWPHVGFDVSVTTGQLGNFVNELKARLQQKWPETTTVFLVMWAIPTSTSASKCALESNQRRILKTWFTKRLEIGMDPCQQSMALAL